MVQNGVSVVQWLRGWFAFALLSLFASLLVAEPAQIMPRASKSLLLDIVHVDQRLLTVGERGHILLSDDNADSWVQAQVPVRQMLTAVHFPTPKLGWAVGHDGFIVNSIDGGAHWVLQRDGLAQQELLNQQKLKNLEADRKAIKQALLAAGSEADHEALVFELEDLALDIEDAEALMLQPPYAPPLLDVYFIDELRGVAVGAFNTLLTTGDGGLNWNNASQLLDNPDEYHLNAVTGDGKGGLWIAGEGGVLFYSADYAASWSSLESPYPGSWFGIDYASGSGRLLLFGLRGNVFYSDDAGSSWRQSQVPDDRSLAGGGFINKQYAVLAGSVGTLLVSEDGGESFTARMLGSRVNLASVTCVGDRSIAVGQGGVHIANCLDAANE